MTEEMTTDALELYCRNRAKAVGELTEYDRALLIDVSSRLVELQNENKRMSVDKPFYCAFEDAQVKECPPLVTLNRSIEARDTAIDILRTIDWGSSGAKGRIEDAIDILLGQMKL